MKSEDIARLAGVSRSTVSRVINNYSNVPDETRRKVMKVIEKYHYSPNSSARALAGKKTDTIGLFIVSIAEKGSSTRVYQNNYFSPFIEAVIDTANERGVYVLVHSIFSVRDYAKIKQAFIEKRMDAGIIVGTEKDIGVIAEVASMGYPLVIIDYSPEDILRLVGKGRISVINSMDDKGTREIIKYLLDLGHKDIGILAGRDNTYSGRVRYKAYKEMLAENGIEPRIEWDLKGEFIKKIAEQAVIDLIKTGNLPTVLFCCNDDMAISAMDVLSRENIKVPDDISIVGFDDIMPASLVKPALTTVRVPIYDIAKKAVELVLEMIEDTARNISTYTLETRLVIRDSCKKHG